MPDQVVVVQACPLCGQQDALVTVGRDYDSHGQLRREWVIEIDCANGECATHDQPAAG